MRKRVLITLLAFVGMLFLLLPAARAQTMQLYFTGNTSGGNLVPYEMILSQPGSDPTLGTTVWMNCDDHYDLIQAGEYWTATVFSGSANNLDDTSMSMMNGWNILGNGETLAAMAYDTKAYIEIVDRAQSGTQAYSDAIWYIFDKANGCNSACLSIYNAATTAVGGDNTNGYLTWRQDTTIFSGPYTDIHNQYGSSPPQEFDLVPDGGMTLMLLGGALVGVATLRRKFRA